MNETLSSILKESVRVHGYKDAKECARAKGVAYELFRKILAGGHIPRDGQLLVYAEKLGLDPAVLIRRAHYERAPDGAKKYLEILLAANIGMSDQYIKQPLSKEELECLEKVLKVLRGQDIKAREALETIVDKLAS